ncbi:MAG: 4Fe-4S dicluster domain-containing protein [Sedimentisphaerales bacterium]|nr:4Fe-4S dicluster domain-containing protein [Sedimentisphaerales bacterium]
MLKNFIFGKRPHAEAGQTCGRRDCACTGLWGKVCDIPGGIYLPGIGEPPSLTIQDWPDYQGPLYLPLATGRTEPMVPIVQPRQPVKQGELLARDDFGHFLYAPRCGVIAEQTTKTVFGHTEQPVLALQTSADATCDVAGANPLADTVNPWQAKTDAERYDLTCQSLARTGIMIGDHGETLIDLIKRAHDHAVAVVVANAVPVEPTLNGPLAVLQEHSPEVFAGLSILKTLLRAPQALAAHSYHFPIDCATAEQWNVRCVAVTEKYPQGLPGVLLRSLNKSPRYCLKRNGAAYIFDPQTLRAVERAVLGGSLLLERIVTVAGDGVLQPGHFRVPVGLPLRALLERAGLTDDWRCVVEGASLTGRSIDPDQAVVSARSGNFMVIRNFKPVRPERCIRCGWCIMDCPAGLDPARLSTVAEMGQYRTASSLNIEACMECGICSYICPSGLPIMESIRMMKRRLHPVARTEGGPLYA